MKVKNWSFHQQPHGTYFATKQHDAAAHHTAFALPLSGISHTRTNLQLPCDWIIESSNRGISHWLVPSAAWALVQSSASYYAIHTYKTKSEATLILITTRASVQFHFVFIRRSYLCSTLIACHKANRSIHSFIHSFIHSHTYPRTVDQNTHSDLFHLPKATSKSQIRNQPSSAIGLSLSHISFIHPNCELHK